MNNQFIIVEFSEKRTVLAGGVELGFTNHIQKLKEDLSHDQTLP